MRWVATGVAWFAVGFTVCWLLLSVFRVPWLP